jgi:hypothetical protein
MDSGMATRPDVPTLVADFVRDLARLVEAAIADRARVVLAGAFNQPAKRGPGRPRKNAFLPLSPGRPGPGRPRKTETSGPPAATRKPRKAAARKQSPVKVVAKAAKRRPVKRRPSTKIAAPGRKPISLVTSASKPSKAKPKRPTRAARAVGNRPTRSKKPPAAVSASAKTPATAPPTTASSGSATPAET